MKIYENRNTLFRDTLVAAALAAALGAGGIARADAASDTAMPQPQSDTSGATAADAAITAQVKAKYMAEDSLKDSNITVTTTDGVVKLAGTLASAETRRIAVELAKGIAGVKSVDTSGLSASSS